MNLSATTVTALRWIARLLAAGLFLFWGAFFVEHLRQWFVQPYPQSPPLSDWFAQFLHLLVLVGLVAGFFWKFVGGILLIVATVLFFWDKAPIYIPLTILPGILYLICWYHDYSARRRSVSAG